jgi:hypothetical protein
VARRIEQTCHTALSPKVSLSIWNKHWHVFNLPIFYKYLLASFLGIQVSTYI